MSSSSQLSSITLEVQTNRKIKANLELWPEFFLGCTSCWAANVNATDHTFTTCNLRTVQLDELNYAHKRIRQLSPEFQPMGTTTKHKAHRSCFLLWADHVVVGNDCPYRDLVISTVMAASHPCSAGSGARGSKDYGKSFHDVWFDSLVYKLADHTWIIFPKVFTGSARCLRPFYQRISELASWERAVLPLAIDTHTDISTKQTSDRTA